jgi:hypothetical protein
MVFGNGMFVAVPYYEDDLTYDSVKNFVLFQKYVYSTDGTNWSARDLPKAQAKECSASIAYGDGGFLLSYRSSSSLDFYWSANGTSWTHQGTPNFNDLQEASRLMSVKDMFMLTGSLSVVGLRISTNEGQTWTAKPGVYGHGAAYGEKSNGTGGRLMLSGTNYIMWSDNLGDSWTTVATTVGVMSSGCFTYAARP